jgi:hypothetical protein
MAGVMCCEVRVGVEGLDSVCLSEGGHSSKKQGKLRKRKRTETTKTLTNDQEMEEIRKERRSILIFKQTMGGSYKPPFFRKIRLKDKKKIAE